MALPLPEVQSAVDCASFNHTVLPFLSQLITLPERLQVAAVAKDVDSLKDIYLSTNPFVTALGFSLALAIGSEDYRWAIVRSKVNNRFVFFIFNIVFISLIQSLVLLLLAAPTYNFLLLSRLPSGKTFEVPDLVFSRVAFFFLIIEYFADQQQWHFHCAKHEYQKTARIPDQYKGQFTPEDLERGFTVSGLWSLSRHPNFLAEQAIWLTLYLWNCYRTESYAQWTGVGVLVLLMIFQGSTRLTESISSSKYPEYSEYQARVGRFIPRFSAKPKYKGKAKKKAKKTEKVEQSEEEEGKKHQ
ncbi:unnamed protein product [Aspergillus oryzae]|nr:unnamed protein product [Aspergillus oryzae]